MRLSSKGSVAPGRFRIERNPALQEPMDCMSARSAVRSVVCCFPIQFGKSTMESAVIGYSMNENPGPIMVCLPGEVSLDKFVAQKLNPLIEESPAVRECLSSVASRDAQNTRTFKDFAGGQLYIEHAGNPKRLKSTSVKILLVDEFTEFATSLQTGDDPVALLEGRDRSLGVGAGTGTGANRPDERACEAFGEAAFADDRALSAKAACRSETRRAGGGSRPAPLLARPRDHEADDHEEVHGDEEDRPDRVDREPHELGDHGEAHGDHADPPAPRFHLHGGQSCQDQDQADEDVPPRERGYIDEEVGVEAQHDPLVVEQADESAERLEGTHDDHEDSGHRRPALPLTIH